MSNPIIKIESLSKRYRIGLKEKRKDTLFGQIGTILRSPIDNFRQLRSLSHFDKDDESVFWALKDINFEVRKGEILGIIGHNGAGKSTLLKILSRITAPTEGRITVTGRIGALLEVGTGFHPELTGRDNIYMNGTILGMTRKEIDIKLDEIIDFSGVEQYIDTPVKYYSTGMKVRLGFSVAAHLEPEILLIDEVLAVGDAQFQKKCFGKMEDIRNKSGRTLLFVSHNMAAIQSICERVIVLKNGRVEFDGEIIQGINTYSSELKSFPKDSHVKDKRLILNKSVNEDGVTKIEYNQPFQIKIKIQHFSKQSFSLYFIIQNPSGENIIHERIDDLSSNGHGKVCCFNIPPLWLRPGIYNYHFKLISTDIASNDNRYISESYTIQVSGNIAAPKMLGSMTPEISYNFE